ncbi:unnamed protein product [Caenorhabditis angaria]|uniref:ribonuclease H n=1 Tax=Caenorhabditis angaria TaxID=860376 RepID=A0A9P1IM45_9PELO|nr:unnamed protein product [Caenorhabditis angaria]
MSYRRSSNDYYYYDNRNQSGNSGRSDRTGVVYTDGACSRNGRSDASAGWGYCWSDSNGRINRESHGPVEGRQTNNRAELVAIRNALESSHSRNYDRVVVRTDSDLACRTMNDYVHKWDRNGYTTSQGTPVANQDVIRQINGLKNDFKEVVFQHVPGHSGHAGNERADQLARQGARQ